MNMGVVTEWVTQIIIFLLLAAIIDLLVPATAMKKYIKLVIGLILMLIFLKPLFFIFNVDMEYELETSLSQLYEKEKETDSLENLIKIQKTEIQASQDAYILEEMTIQLRDVAESPLLEQYQTEIVEIDYLFLTADEKTYEQLEEVIVYLRTSDQMKGAISIVDDVVISPGKQEKVMEVDADETEEISTLLREIWELGDKQLTIKWGGGPS